MNARAILVINLVSTEKSLDEIDACGRLKNNIVHFGDPAFLGSSCSGTRPWSRQRLEIQKGNIDEVANIRGYEINNKHQ